MTVITKEEILKGLTDVPLALIALILGILLIRKAHVRQEWKYLFCILFPSAVLGVIVHTFSIHGTLYIIIWLVLNVLMFELIRTFAHLMKNYVEKNQEEEKKITYVYEGILLIASEILVFIKPDKSIYLFVIFSVICIIRIFVVMFTEGGISTKITIMMMVFLLALILQALKARFPAGVAIAHLLVCINLFVLYEMALEGETHDE